MLDFICGRYRIEMSRPLIMGILNLTPDSFSDGGCYVDKKMALHAAQAMIEAGVDMIDIGGESTRPGAVAVPLQEELDRVLPVIEALRDCGKPLSIDTYKPEIMQAALALNVDMVNDVRALTIPGALQVISQSRCAIVLMHMKHDPHNMQLNPSYQNVVTEVSAFFQQRLTRLKEEGIALSRVMLDPGFGFGKTLAHNLDLLKQLSCFSQFDRPILVGLSRKSMLGELTKRPIDQREFASVSAAVLAAEQGAKVLRVHNVAATVDALRIWAAVRGVPWKENIAIRQD